MHSLTDYKSGNISVIWNESYKDLLYEKCQKPSSEVKNWIDDGYTNFLGSMYSNKNPMPSWIDEISTMFPKVNDKMFTFYKMTTLEIMPSHIDKFLVYTDLFCKKRENIRRILIFLEDWKPGHYFELDNKGIVNWKAGDFYIWSPDTIHAASNIGIEPRYTLQITCHV